MKKQTLTPPIDAERAALAQLEEQHDNLCIYEGGLLTKATLLRAELDSLLRSADLAKPAAIAKPSAKLRADITETESAIADCRDLQDRLWADILARRQQLQKVETIEQRKDAAHAVFALTTQGAPIDRLATQLVAAIGSLRVSGSEARNLVEPVLHTLHPDPMVMEDMRQIVLPRASASGPEMASAIAAILYAIAGASGAELDTYVTFNELIRGNTTMVDALKAGSEYIGSRLGVQ